MSNGRQIRRLILPASHAHLVRNVGSGRVLPCCFEDCERAGNDTIRVEVPHTQPRWKDEAAGTQEMLVYIFCSEAHKAFFVVGTSYENRA